MFLTRSAKFAFALSAALLSGTAALAQTSFELGDRTNDYPQAFTNWCNDNVDDCHWDDETPAVVKMTPDTWAILKYVNSYWNKNVVPTEDIVRTKGRLIDQWRRARKGDQADCEDIMLAKAYMLVKLFRWPKKALQFTVVKDEKNEGHAILAAKTDAGDYILDNKTEDIQLWSQTPYTFNVAYDGGNWRVITTLKPRKWDVNIAHDSWGATVKTAEPKLTPPADIPVNDQLAELILADEARRRQTTAKKPAPAWQTTVITSQYGLRLNRL